MNSELYNERLKTARSLGLESTLITKWKSGNCRFYTEISLNKFTLTAANCLTTMKFSFHSILFMILLAWSCAPGEQGDVDLDDELFQKDLDSIKTHGKLRALTTYSATSYFLYRGEPMGFEYELLKRFTEYLGLELELVVTDNIDSMFHQLNTGDVDIVAHGFAITGERKENVEFTDYLYLVNQVLVQRKPDNWRKISWSKLESQLIHDPIQLIGDTISVRQNSSYFKRLENLSDEIGGKIIIDTLPGHLSTDEIIKMVANGKIKYTVADNNIAAINASYYPQLDINVPISFSQRIAWAVRPGSDSLLYAANKWIEQMKKKQDYYVIYNKYFKNKTNYSRRVKSDFYSLNKNAISAYDDLIKRYAEKIDWDWRLLASLVYQESKFEPIAQSWAMASGLMQIMPSTADELGINDIENPEENIRGGTEYLQQIGKNFEHIPDSLDRLKFTMAAFNCGIGHVFDAQRLASKRGLDSLVWDNNVEDMILALSYSANYNDPVVYYGYVRGIETYTYVQQIIERYGHYQQFIKRENDFVAQAAE